MDIYCKTFEAFGVNVRIILKLVLQKEVFQDYEFNLLRAESGGKFGWCGIEITPNPPHFATLVIVLACLADTVSHALGINIQQ
jgi:hypothetical protein